MDLAEIERYLGSSIAHSVSVDVRELAELPGYLRTVTIHPDLRVSIELLPCEVYAKGDREGGNPKYVARYKTLAEAVAALEGYLDTPIAAWTNFTRDPYEPVLLNEPNAEANLAHLESLVRHCQVRLPSGAKFLNMTMPWRHLERYGEYRRDKIEEEQDLLWQEGVEAGLFDAED